MRFAAPLAEGRLIRRYKRFLADVEFPGGVVETVHCANPGAMTGLNAPGSRVFVSRSDNPKRKLPLSLELLEADGVLVGINTAHPNALVADAIAAGALAPFTGYARLRREVAYGERSRVDILLEDDARPRAYVEVKNVHLMRRPGAAEFPDSVTARGARHLAELSAMVAQGHRAAMVFLIQRPDARTMAIAADIDPAYAKAFAAARAAGVEAYAWRCAITPEAITVTDAVAIV
ncbi:DNA/RNA nuclease SfsA [Pseudoxanthobacter sp.]|uniref:DNA/RNA nuclease SfsA n=1 Tax=Pseudoxanthobacter sp. TaxID=1925742 RepID=UPI002FDFDAD4